MKTKTLIRLGLVAAAGLALSACGGGGGGSSTPTPVMMTFADQFGAGFGTDFAASPNSQPAVPQSGDIIALSLTTQPVALP